MRSFSIWSTACGSGDVPTVLQQPAALLQVLQQSYAPGTAASYLQGVCQVLQLPAVAALLPPAELASLLQQLLAAKQQHVRRHNYNKRSGAAAAAAAPPPPPAAPAAPALNLQQLRGVLGAYHCGRAKRARMNAMYAFKAWSNACETTDVRTMLQQPAVLLQALQQEYKASTAVVYLNSVRAVLRVPAVAALLPPSETAALLQQLKQAVQEVNRSHSKSGQAHGTLLLLKEATAALV
jgi:hypothetical protein